MVKLELAVKLFWGLFSLDDYKVVCLVKLASCHTALVPPTHLYRTSLNGAVTIEPQFVNPTS